MAGQIHLPPAWRGRQSLKFGIRLTNTRFGEVMPSRILSGSGFQGDNYAIMCKIAEWPQAWVKQHAYNIDYTWKPQNSRWLDLQASLWAMRTEIQNQLRRRRARRCCLV